MADRLKGITVEISGDTTGLNRALENVNSESRTLQNELSDVERLLKFNPDNVELIAQRQQVLNRQIETTSNKLNQLRQVEHQVQAQFERGDIGADQFRAFQREIIATEGRLHHFERQAQETGRRAKGSFKEMGSGIANGIAGAVAGAGVGEIISKSLEASSLDTKIKLSFDVPEDAIPKVKNIIASVQAFGVEGEAALEGVRKQFALNGDLTDKQNQKIVESAALISKAYGDIDFTELIQESNEFGEAIGISQEDALAMTNTLLKAGFPPDQLDIMSEYGSQLKRAGYNASEIQGIFKAGVETKSWNIDVLLDGVKEGRIRLAEFGQGIDKTTAGLIKGTDISAKKLQDWGTAIAEGGDAGKIAFGEVATELGKVHDDTQRNAIGTRLFGTLWEEQGSKITQALSGANTEAGNYKENQKGMNDALAKQKNDPQYKLNEALKDMNKNLTPLLTSIAEFIGKIADWVKDNPKLAATLLAIGVAIGVITAGIFALIPAIVLLTTADWGLVASLLPIILPILGIIAAIGLAIVIIILLRKNWDKIMKKGRELAASISKSFSNFKKAAADKMEEARRKISDIWDRVMKFFKGISLKKIGGDIIDGLRKGIVSKATKVYEKAKEIANKIASTMKFHLDSDSPSKVTMKIGEDTGEGLAIGLQNKISKIGAISKKMASASTPNPPAASSTVNNNGKSMVVNLSSPKALDVREANKEFNRTFNKMSLMW